MTNLFLTHFLRSRYGVATILVQAAIATFLRVHELPLKLAGLALDNLTIDIDLLMQQLYKHLCTQILNTLKLNGVPGGSILGSLAILGDVGTVFKKLGGSVSEITQLNKDPVLDPDAPASSPIGSVVARSSAAVLGGAGGALSRISGSIGSGLAVLSLDETFRKDRRKALAAKPVSLRSGIRTGFTQFGKGVVSGVTGLVEQPLRGGQRGGFVGGIGGVGKGIAGLIVKPATGALDMLHSSFAGIESFA